MPRGKVTFTLLGGPFDGQEMTLPSSWCYDRLQIEDPIRFSMAAESVKIVKGDDFAQRDPNWLGFSTHIYIKQARKRDAPLYYKYDSTVEVLRCERVLQDKGRRCKNAAEPGETLCKQHLRMSRES